MQAQDLVFMVRFINAVCFGMERLWRDVGGKKGALVRPKILLQEFSRVT